MPEREAPPARPLAQKAAPQRKGGLGRGLAALIPTAPAQPDGAGAGSSSIGRATPTMPGSTIPAPPSPRSAEPAAESAGPVSVGGAVR